MKKLIKPTKDKVPARLKQTPENSKIKGQKSRATKEAAKQKRAYEFENMANAPDKMEGKGQKKR